MFGGGLPYAWPFAAVALYFADNFIDEYKIAYIKTEKFLSKIAIDDRFKVQRIEQLVDMTKDMVKMRTFPNKKYKSGIKASFKAAKGMTEEEAKQAAEDFMKRRK